MNRHIFPMLDDDFQMSIYYQGKLTKIRLKWDHENMNDKNRHISLTLDKDFQMPI